MFSLKQQFTYIDVTEEQLPYTHLNTKAGQSLLLNLAFLYRLFFKAVLGPQQN